MSQLTMKDARVYVGRYDLTGDMNHIAIAYKADMLDATVFGVGTHIKRAGLMSVMAQLEGFVDVAGAAANGSDEAMFARLGAGGIPLTVTPQFAADGDRCFSFFADFADYKPGGNVGDMLKFSASAEAVGSPLVRGNTLVTGLKSATGNGTAFQLGAISATQKLYGALHVFSKTGTLPTLDVKIQSDDNAGFSSPTDRIVFSQKIAESEEWATPIAGPITDDYWRAVWTIGGSSGPSFNIAVVMGIL